MFVCTCDENNSRTGNFNTYICQYLYDTITYMYIHHVIIILYMFAPLAGTTHIVLYRHLPVSEIMLGHCEAEIVQYGCHVRDVM